LHALKAFNAEFKTGSRSGLTPDELAPEPEVEGLDKRESVLGIKSAVKAKEKNGKVIPPSRISQSKILRTVDRVDALTGLGRSKGYGFLEATSHADALRVLRWINANSDVGFLLKSWQADDLKSAIKKIQRRKEPNKEDEERIERLQAKIDELEAGTQNHQLEEDHDTRMARTLIVEFSIE